MAPDGESSLDHQTVYMYMYLNTKKNFSLHCAGKVFKCLSNYLWSMSGSNGRNEMTYFVPTAIYKFKQSWMGFPSLGVSGVLPPMAKVKSK